MPYTASAEQRKKRLANACRFLAVTALATAALVSTSFQSAPARSLTSKQATAASHGQAQPTAGWSRFCAQHPGECSVDPAEPEVIALTPQVLALITATNRRVNDTIDPITDQEHWGVLDRWDYPEDGKGDCEDIQLLKRMRLVEQGLPRRAMRMTVVIDKKGEGHAVLMVRTSAGDLILDNTHDAVLPWRQTGYKYLKREGSDGRAWVSLKEQKSPVATAARQPSEPPSDEHGTIWLERRSGSLLNSNNQQPPHGSG
jgi:predicted transglutaminase-like cysteine proteinase